MEERLRSHYDSLARAVRFTRTADSKAAPVLALQIALIGALAARGEHLWTIISTAPWDAETTALVAILSSYALFFVGAVLFAGCVYLPSTPRAGGSLVYFEDIAHMDYEEFQARGRTMWPGQIEGQLMDQIHRVSRIASLKMRRVRCAFF